MRALLHRLHEVWCALTSQCAVDPPDDAYIQWMKDQERESVDARARRQQARQPTGNMAEDTVFLHRPKGGPQ